MPTNPTAYPLGPPTISGTDVTVDLMLLQPTRVNRFLAEYLGVNRQQFIIDQVLSSGGGVTGGAVIYEEQALNDFYLTRDIQQVAPGAEFPLVTSARRSVKIATPSKWGGKYYITDEERDRNDQRAMQRQTIQLANTIIRKMNLISIDTFEAKITEMAGAATMVGHDWSAAIPNGSSPTAPASTPMADFGAVQLLGTTRELGITFDTWIGNPTDFLAAQLFFLNYPGGLEAAARQFGIENFYSTQFVPVGTAYVVSKGNVGEIRMEQPLTTVTWREDATERTWVQSSVRPVFYIDNPYALLKVTGL